MENKPAIKAIIVDELPQVMESLRMQLKMLDNVEVLGETGSHEEVLELISEFKPNLVFIDISLHGANRFEFLDELKKHPNINIDIVFISANGNHALESFEYYPFNFLIKPIDCKKLKDVVNRYHQKMYGKNYIQPNGLEYHKKNTIHFKGENGYIWLKIDEILWFKADRNYSVVFLKNGEKELLAENLGAIVDIIPVDIFYKSHRSYLINLLYLRKINKQTGKISLSQNPFDENPLIAKENIPCLLKKMGE